MWQHSIALKPSKCPSRRLYSWCPYPYVSELLLLLMGEKKLTQAAKRIRQWPDLCPFLLICEQRREECMKSYELCVNFSLYNVCCLLLSREPYYGPRFGFCA